MAPITNSRSKPSTQRSARGDSSAFSVVVLILSGCLLITSLSVLLMAAHIQYLESHGRGAGGVGDNASTTTGTDYGGSFHTNLRSQSRQSSNIGNIPTYLRRFPLYETSEFKQACRWAMPDETTKTAVGSDPDCYILSRPRPSSSEGISEWVADVAAGKIYSIQLGCHHILDYGTNGVDVHSALTQVDTNSYSNWTVPESIMSSGCDSRSTQLNCQQASAGWTQRTIPTVRRTIARIKAVKGQNLAPKTVTIPNYRWSYHASYAPKLLAFLPDLVESSKTGSSNIKGFQYESGMACALGATFELAPSAADHVPALHSQILPALRDSNTLVIALYARTGRTDDLLKGSDKHSERKDEAASKPIISCVLQMERELLSISAFERVVWFIATDSPDLGKSILASYDNVDVSVVAHGSQNAIYHRRVYTTASKGLHSKAQVGPKTDAFSEAIVDWHLLGESNVVVTFGSGYTFAHSAALRTARPIYQAAKDECHALEIPSLSNKTLKLPTYQY